MSEQRDLLVEIGTEELPPKALLKLSAAFKKGVVDGFNEVGLKFEKVTEYAAPRRLALVISQLETAQPDKTVERRGPAVQAAFGEDGCPTKAAQGFASSCGVTVEQLETLETDKGAWLVFRSEEKGQPAAALIPGIVTMSLDKLPIPKRMRWADLDAEFVRPVHWAILLFGDEVIEADILSVRSARETRGHRFHHPETITIPAPAEYEMLLESHGKVIADFDRRRQAIRGQVEEIAIELGGKAIIDEDLLNEVASMVEWPVAVKGNFEKRFLDVPQEALISTMSANQKYFHVVDSNNKLMPHFITVSNIDSKDFDRIREGNERVIRPRFSDAEFFWNQDRKQSLAARVESLGTVVFQKDLGTLLDKTRRVAKLAGYIADQLGGNKQLAMRAAELCKCDLMTNMVYEFTELQGIMGRYYATHDGEATEVASALDDYYKPRFAGDDLPAEITSQSLAIADRLDTLTGIFAIGQTPTGDKDPFALRRASLGVLRILIEQNCDLDLLDLIRQAASAHDKSIRADKAVNAVFDFMLDRLNAYYQDRNILPDVRDAVLSLKPAKPADIDQRLRAVTAFRELPAAESLAAANKRIGNILKKVEGELPQQIDAALLQEKAEKDLYQQLTSLQDKVDADVARGAYADALQALADLRENVDAFFDNVMVMAEDMALRNNRIALLNSLHGMFMKIADISKLQG